MNNLKMSFLEKFNLSNYTYMLKLLAILAIGFGLFFCTIQQVNSLSIQNNKTRVLTNEQKKKESAKESILSQNRTELVQEIDRKLASGDIQNTVIGENIKLSELENILKNQQPSTNQNNFYNTIIVAR
jgi:hypothetical protein